MWVFTTDGFYSAVAHKSEPNTLVVRCRVRADAERLTEALYPWLGAYADIQHTPTADYHWRVFVPRSVFASYLVAYANNMDYPNFKAEVATRQGHERAAVYSDVWLDLLQLQRR